MSKLSLDKNAYVIDIETDGLLPYSTPNPEEWLTKIHCISIAKVNKRGELKVITLTSYEEMKDFFEMEDVIYVGHNLSLFDIPAVKYILEIEPKGVVIDTLSLSWYLECKRMKHGLETYAIEYGTNKVVVEDWNKSGEEGLELYIARCEKDVQLNYQVWVNQKAKLLRIYETEKAVWKLITYLQAKLLIIEQQLNKGIELDVELCNQTIKELQTELDAKLLALKEAMPKAEVIGKKKVPRDKITNKDGTYSKKYLSWLEFKSEYNIPDDYEGEYVEYVSGYVDGNPGSPAQIKNWLFGLGWEPSTYSFVRDKETNETKQIPQVQNKDTGEVCDCVKILFDKEPKLALLNGVGIIKHRLGLLNGFIRDAIEQPDGTYRVYAGVNKWTNTLRLSHRTIVNLPGVKKLYAKNVRACLKAGEGEVWISADISGLEDNTKLSEMYLYDKEYVEEILNNPNWDPHLNISKLAKYITQEDEDFYIWFNKELEDNKHFKPTEEQKERISFIKKQRQLSKVLNFSATYKVGKKTLARNSGMTEKQAEYLLGIYWERNKAILEIERNYKVKTVDGEMWLYGKYSKIWYSLRNDKDRFSTGNQSLGDYVFTRWLCNIAALGYFPVLQMHDEWNGVYPIEQKEEVVEALKVAMDMTNKQLGLNVEIKIAIQTGQRYSETH